MWLVIVKCYFERHYIVHAFLALLGSVLIKGVVMWNCHLGEVGGGVAVLVNERPKEFAGGVEGLLPCFPFCKGELLCGGATVKDRRAG